MSGRRRAGDRDRQAGAIDQDLHVYARLRDRQRRQRAAQDRANFDPGPPTDDDWVVGDPDTDGVRKIGPPTTVGEELERFITRRGWRERLRGADAWARWEGIVGPDLASRCEPVRLAGGTLVVRAENAAWATQLRYLLPTMQVNVERELGAGSVKQIQIVVGPLQRPGDHGPGIDEG